MATTMAQDTESLLVRFDVADRPTSEEAWKAAAWTAWRARCSRRMSEVNPKRPTGGSSGRRSRTMYAVLTGSGGRSQSSACRCGDDLRGNARTRHSESEEPVRSMPESIAQAIFNQLSPGGSHCAGLARRESMNKYTRDCARSSGQSQQGQSVGQSSSRRQSSSLA